MTMLSDRPQATVRSAGPVSDAERLRLEEAGTGTPEWRDWGPYLSERAWGTVREDYSADGDAWSFFPHEHARSRVYRWNEDGMAGFSDETQNWCLSLGLWNGVDPILKERMFGLTGPQGNHGEDVKEYWWYLDGTPHAFLAHLALPLPAAGVPLRRPGRRERPPGQAGTRIRVWSTPVHSTMPGIGWSPSITPRPAPGSADENHRGERRAGRSDPARAAHVLVPQHLVVVVFRSPEAEPVRISSRDPDRQPTHPPARPRCSGRDLRPQDGLGRCAVPVPARTSRALHLAGKSGSLAARRCTTRGDVRRWAAQRGWLCSCGAGILVVATQLRSRSRASADGLPGSAR